MNYHSKHEDPFAQSHQKQNEKKQIILNENDSFLHESLIGCPLAKRAELLRTKITPKNAERHQLY